MPEADRQTCQISGAQRRDFTHFRAFHAGAENIGLELHQEVVGDRAAVHAQGVQTNTGVGLHRFQNVTRLIGDRFQRGADNMVGVHSAGQAENRAARIRIPVWRAKTGKGRHHIHAVGVLHLSGEVFRIESIVDEFHFITQPLNRRSGHKHRAFQRVVHFAGRAAGDSGQQAVG